METKTLKQMKDYVRNFEDHRKELEEELENANLFGPSKSCQECINNTYHNICKIYNYALEKYTKTEAKLQKAVKPRQIRKLEKSLEELKWGMHFLQSNIEYIANLENRNNSGNISIHRFPQPGLN